MNRQDGNALCDVASSGIAQEMLIKGSSVSSRFDWMAARLGPVLRAPSDVESVSRVRHVALSRQGGKPELLGTPIFLTVCFEFLIWQRRALGLFLKACCQAIADVAGQLGLSRLVEVFVDSAATSEAFFGGHRSRVGTSKPGQTLRNRELGQLCQTKNWLKRYKTGMFANLAMLANDFSQKRPSAGSLPMTRWSRPRNDVTPLFGDNNAFRALIDNEWLHRIR